LQDIFGVLLRIPEQGQVGLGPADIQMGGMLPGEADPAVQASQP
jgi:hypothetical protein